MNSALCLRRPAVRAGGPRKNRMLQARIQRAYAVLDAREPFCKRMGVRARPCTGPAGPAGRRSLSCGQAAWAAAPQNRTPSADREVVRRLYTAAPPGRARVCRDRLSPVSVAASPRQPILESARHDALDAECRGTMRSRPGPCAQRGRLCQSAHSADDCRRDYAHIYSESQQGFVNSSTGLPLFIPSFFGVRAHPHGMSLRRAADSLMTSFGSISSIEPPPPPARPPQAPPYTRMRFLQPLPSRDVVAARAFKDALNRELPRYAAHRACSTPALVSCPQRPEPPPGRPSESSGDAPRSLVLPATRPPARRLGLDHGFGHGRAGADAEGRGLSQG